MKLHPSILRPAATVAVLAFLGCQVVGPTIPQRAALEADRDPIEVVPVEVPELEELDTDAPYVSDESAYLEPPRIADDRLVSFEMRNTPLAQAIHMIAEAAKVNIYLDAELERVVDASFPNVTLDNALQVLLSRNGLSLVEEPSGVFWVTPNDGSQSQSAWFRVQSIDAESVTDDLSALVADGATVVVNAEQNFVLVDGTARDVELIAAYLSEIDRLKRQVLLEVEIVEVILSENFEVSVSHAIANGDLGGPDNTLSLMQELATTNDNFSLVFENPTVPLTSTLTALQSYAGVNLLSSPRVLAVTKSPASVEVTTEVPFIQVTATSQVAGGDAGSATVEEVEFKEVGIKMVVTPTVQEGGVVEIVIEQELSEVVDFFNGIPVVDIRNLKTVMLVGDEHTAVLGGLRQNRVTETDFGVPVLMDIPWLGRLFRSDEDVTQRRELLLFVTPRILEPSQAASLAGELRRDYSETVRLSGVTPAEDL